MRRWEERSGQREIEEIALGHQELQRRNREERSGPSGAKKRDRGEKGGIAKRGEKRDDVGREIAKREKGTVRERDQGERYEEKEGLQREIGREIGVASYFSSFFFLLSKQ